MSWHVPLWSKLQDWQLNHEMEAGAKLQAASDKPQAATIWQ
jgi:hypothetical protein